MPCNFFCTNRIGQNIFFCINKVSYNYTKYYVKTFNRKVHCFLHHSYVNVLVTDRLTVQLRYYLIKLLYQYSAMYFGVIAFKRKQCIDQISRVVVCKQKYVWFRNRYFQSMLNRDLLHGGGSFGGELSSWITFKFLFI